MDIRQRLEALQLQALPQERTLDLDLASPAGLERSRVLHQLRVLAIPGVQRIDTALAMRRFVDHRLTPLLERAAGDVRPGPEDAVT